MSDSPTWTGYLRQDGRKGVRNLVLVIYTVECSHHVAEKIAEGEDGIQVIGFHGCYDNAYAVRLILALARHPNVGAVLSVGLGCEYTQPHKIADVARKSGRLADSFYIQESGGTSASIEKGKKIVRQMREQLDRDTPKVPMGLQDLVIGCECGGSDFTSGLVGNPVVGKVFDHLVDAGGTAIFEEIVEAIGMKEVLVERGVNQEVKNQLSDAYDKAEEYSMAVRQYSVSPGNFAGGLTTIEEKSMGALCKSGSRPIQGVIKVAQTPSKSGLWLLDSVPDKHFMGFGYTNPNDTEGLMDLIAAGSQIVILVTGRGSVVGSAISPLIKVTGNSLTYKNMEEDMDFDAGRVLDGQMSLDQAASELLNLIVDVASGIPSKPECLGHREYLIMYKHQNPPFGSSGCRL